MATQRPGFAISFPELAAALLSQSEVAPRARLVAQQLSIYFPESAVVVYLLDQDEGWLPKATEGEVAFAEATIPADSGTLGKVLQKQKPLVFTGAELPREQYAHLNIRRTIVSLAAIPLMVDEAMVGAAEVLSFKQRIEEPALAGLSEFTKIAALGLAAGFAYENERNNQLESLTRITQMYDLEKVFNSNLEMSDLMNMITSKFHEIMRVQAVNLWMVDAEGVVLTSQTGYDPTAEIGSTQKKGEGIAGDLADSGEAVQIEDPNDERLAKRNTGVEEGAVFSLVAAPVMDRGALVGIVEAINRNDGNMFDEDDQFFLTMVCETASNALHNASLLQAERKVEILETLVKVSQDITSTLDIDRVMHSIVNGPQGVIPYERAAIALDQRGRLKMGAISGMPEIHAGDPVVESLKDMLDWAGLSEEPTLVRQHDEEIDADRAETRAKFEKYFAESGMRGFYAIPLGDDTGRLGIMSFESSDPDFLTDAHIEMIKILVGQATVAMRNAAMYKEVPFIGVLEPVLARKRAFLKMEKRRRTATVALAAVAVLVLIFLPFPMRLAGDATVAPAHTAQIQPQVEGVVQKVYVREGDPVKRGTIIADLQDTEYRSALAAAQARYDSAASAMNRALAGNDGTEAGVQRVQADYWSAEVRRARERLESTHLRSPIDGVVVTPHIENLAGRKLQFGDSFAEVMDSSTASVDVALDEQDVSLAAAGEKAAVKLEGYPGRTFRGEVSVVSPRSETLGDTKVFYARVAVPNPDGVIRAGMEGRGKVSAGWHAVGYVIFRRPGMWFTSKLWSWFGW